MTKHTKNLSCRICSGPFFEFPILQYSNAPASAQGFLDQVERREEPAELFIYQCQYCGTVQHNSPPVSYYKDVIRSVSVSAEMTEFRLQQFNTWLTEKDLRDKQILEIGCGKGEYLDLLRTAGSKNLFGIENSSTSIKAAQDKGFNIAHGYIDRNFSSPWKKLFSAFCVFNFMEHWPDVVGSLQSIHAMLENNACGLIEVPNFDYISQKNLYSEFVADHIFYFNKKSLELILTSNGFEIESIEPIWHDYILSARILKRQQINSLGFASQQKKVINELRNYISQFASNEVIVWGAGHQSLAILSIADIGSSISHIVDSAAFKQGKFTPGTYIKIKGPNSIYEDKPIAIVIIAAAYSDEIAADIFKNYSNVKHVAILRDDGIEVVKYAI